MNITERIHEIATEYCSDYPDIENKSDFEQLYAIESTLSGTKQANEECHKMIKILGGMLNMTTDEIYNLWIEKITNEEK